VIFVRDRGADARHGCDRGGGTAWDGDVVAVKTFEELAHGMKDE
jgi:hypothetical protein